MNNFERIKQMTVDEMVQFVRHATSCEDICSFYKSCSFERIDCNTGIKQWLLKEYKDE
jgi:hypothetical protein